jgi:integrase
MTVTKTPSGRFRASVKFGRRVVASKTFDLKRDADAWHDAQKRALALGDFIDPKAGKVLVRDALTLWTESRKYSVSPTTYTEETGTLKSLPASIVNKPVAAIHAADLDALYAMLVKTLARSTVTRFRNTLSSFFSWAVREGMIAQNPAIPSRVPRGTGTDQKHEIWPFSLTELNALHTDLTEKFGAEHADILLVLGHTGLRWGELSALRVRDVQLVPRMAILVSRSHTDGHPVRTTTKSGKVRTVPVVDAIAGIMRVHVSGRQPDDPLFASQTGSLRLLANFKRSVRWDVESRGRRIHDLRHTAATLWLQNGVDLKTAQAWLGHSSAKLTADTYAHWLGSDADTAAVARLNSAFAIAGYAGGTRARKL